MFSRNFFTVGKPKMFEILFVEIKNYYQPLYRNRTKWRYALQIQIGSGTQQIVGVPGVSLNFETYS